MAIEMFTQSKITLTCSTQHLQLHLQIASHQGVVKIITTFFKILQLYNLFSASIFV